MPSVFKTLSILMVALVVTGCSSASAEKERQLSLLANTRANLLASKLPLEAGPLSIMRANSNGSTVEIMMVYNADALGAKPATQVMNNSINTYCTVADTKANLEVGLSYRIKMRNSRGQLIADEIVTHERCLNAKR